MNKSDLINHTAAGAGISKTKARQVIDAMVGSIEETLSTGDKVSIKGFGTFKTGERASKKVRNLHTSEMITLPATRVPLFKPGKPIKDRVAASSTPAGCPAVKANSEKRPHAEAGAAPVSAAEQRPLSGQPKVIAVTSGKGGTGKTNFVINSAIALAQRGLKVYIIDADLGTANVDVLLGLNCKNTINTLVEDKSMSLIDIITEGPEGIKIIPGGSGLQSLAELPSEELSRIIGMLRPLEELADVILIDTGSGISRNVVDFVLAADEVVVVITPEPHSISDAYAIIKVIGSKENRPSIKMVFNQVDSYSEARQVAVKLHDVAERFLGIQPLTIGHILKDDNLVNSVKKFKPLVLYNPLAPAARCISAIAEKLVPLPEELREPAADGKGFLGKLKSLFSRPAG